MNYRSLVFYVAAVFFLSLVYFASPMSRDTMLHLFPGTEAMAHANPVTTALIFLAASAILTFLAFPSMPIIYMAAGFYMEGLGGVAIVLLGSVFGGLSAFLFYRKLIRRPGEPVDRQPARNIWLTLIGLRLSPLVPAPLVNFFAAVCHVSPFQYLMTSLVGSAPLVFVFSQFGQQGYQVLSGGTFHSRQFSGYFIILALSTLLSAMGPWRALLNDFKRLKASSELEPLGCTQPHGCNL